MCPSCKRVRDDQGFWEQLETHVARTSGASFTHGLCQSCLQRELDKVDGIDGPQAGQDPLPGGSG